MSDRDNRERLRNEVDDNDEEEMDQTQQGADPLSFISPVNVVDLPSAGKFYPDKHPLSGKDHIEIKSMTAEEEDILNNKSLVKKGKAFDKVINNLLRDKPFSSSDMFTGDKTAILFEARRDAYSKFYEVNLTCPICSTHEDIEYDLEEEPTVNRGGVESVSEEDREEYSVGHVGDDKFKMDLLDGNVTTVFRLLTGADQEGIAVKERNEKKHNIHTNKNVERLCKMIVSMNGRTSAGKIREFVKTAPARETRKLKNIYGQIAPSYEMEREFTCDECNYFEVREVPIRATFFWPDRKSGKRRRKNV